MFGKLEMPVVPSLMEDQEYADVWNRIQELQARKTGLEHKLDTLRAEGSAARKARNAQLVLTGQPIPPEADVNAERRQTHTELDAVTAAMEALERQAVSVRMAAMRRIRTGLNGYRAKMLAEMRKAVITFRDALVAENNFANALERQDIEPYGPPFIGCVFGYMGGRGVAANACTRENVIERCNAWLKEYDETGFTTKG